MSVFCCVKCIIYEINREPKRIFSQSLVRVPATISHRTGVIVSTRMHSFCLFTATVNTVSYCQKSKLVKKNLRLVGTS